MMPDQSQSPKDPKAGMHIEVGQITASGHVAITGGDAHIVGDTKRETTQSQAITAGGIQTTKEFLEELLASISKIDTAIEESDLPPEKKDAAKQNATNLREQLTSKDKPNGYLLAQAAKALYRFGPRIAGALVAAFATPLAGHITVSAGQTALEFYRKLQQVASNPPTE